jgi:hypothetical protein
MKCGYPADALRISSTAGASYSTFAQRGGRDQRHARLGVGESVELVVGEHSLGVGLGGA